MIVLYGLASPAVYRVAIMLEEVGAAYRIEFVNVFEGAQYDPEFLRISPNNKTPAILDPEGPGGRPIALCESAAILIYLAEKAGRLLSTDPVVRLSELQWLMVATSSIGPTFGQANHFWHSAPADEAYGRARYRSHSRHLLGVLDRRLADTRWLGGDDYSIADISAFAWVHWALENAVWVHADRGFARHHEAVTRWLKEIGRRDAVVRGVQSLEPAKVAGGKAKEAAGSEALDRLYLRGSFAV